MRAEDLKVWLASARRGGKEREVRIKDRGDGEGEQEAQTEAEGHWRRVVEIVQTAFREGELSEEVTRQAVVLIPKGKGDYRDIGLVEVMWKVMAVILNRRLTSSITFHDVLHGFRAGRGTGTATLEAKLLQQRAAMREEVLYVIFLDLTKAYDALDRSRCLDILEGYGVGPGASSYSVTSWRLGRRRIPPGCPGTWTCLKRRTL